MIDVHPQPLEIGATTEKQQLVTHLGGDTIYYKASRDVSSASSDGTLTAGQQLKLTSTKWFATAVSRPSDGKPGAANLAVEEKVPSINRLIPVAGVPSDSSFDYTPLDGTQAVNSLTNTEYVRINGSWVATSANGPQGPAGAGAMGTDVWAYAPANGFGASASVTDWGPVVNAIIASGAKLLNFSAHDFPCSTTINLNNKYSITFQGEGGGVHPTVGGASDHASARLIWTGGSGTGPMVKMDGSDGIAFRNMGLFWTGASGFDGDLIRADYSSTQAANGLFERCEIAGSDLGTTLTARSLLRLTNAVSFTVRECSLWAAQSAIRGFETTDIQGQATNAQHPDNNTIVHNTFANCAVSFITNVGTNWTIEDNEFLFGSFTGVTTPSAVTSDITCGSDFTFTTNRLWDFVDATQHGLNQLVGNTWTARIKDNTFHTHAGVNINLNGPGNITIEDNGFARPVSNGGVALIDLGNPATAYKNYVRIKGNGWSSSSTPANVIANIAGHGVVEIGPNSEAQGLEAHAPEVSTAPSHQRAHWSLRYVAAVALAAGQPAITVDGKTQDGFGYITFQTPGGSASVAGKLATVTFGTALEKGYGQGTPDATHQVPLVQLFPYGISNDGVSGGATVAAGFYVQVTGGQQTTFDIYTTNAIPLGTKVGIGYRLVTQM